MLDGLDSQGLNAPEVKFGAPKQRLDPAADVIKGDTEDGIMGLIKKVEGGSH